MKVYEINIVKIKNKDLYYILDFTITRPIIGHCFTLDQAIYFAKGYKQGIEINSYLEFQPKISAEVEEIEVLDDYLKNKKQYYKKLWKSEE